MRCFSIDVLRVNVAAGKFQFREFVIMSDHRQHREYIVQNPVKAGLVETAEQYPYSYTYLAKQKAQGLKSVCEYSEKNRRSLHYASLRSG
jgi:hypothetical protein